MRTKNRVRETREGKGWSQARLAQEAGVHYRSIQFIEAGREPRIDTAIKIAKALGIRLDRLFDGRVAS